ncbi:hypothetical protein [Cytobacillus firmus]|uniref:hypothetical protein n=1 Tax=Cytobacillus firmus TaxID=1399 RepID=UPI001C8EE8D9|nr:hypothetical protein [Cytobacillus firmus]MBX9976009.1 hypothetical protein [Cytobacillus firmus]
MAWILLLPVVIWFIFFLRKKLSFKFDLSPKSLDIKPIKGLKKLSDHLEKSLSKSYMANVEERVIKEIKLKENEYSWRLLDLKRYFILTSLLKESPMFSGKVDDLWHQMLMFTREYDDFSKEYLGSTLHHSPNLNKSPEPDLRGFFDWVYGELFFIRNENIHLYKGFYRFPVPPNIIDEFKRLPENELIELYFKSDSQYMDTAFALISAMKKTAKKVKNYEKRAIQEMMRKRKNQQNYNAMLVPFLSVSYFHYDDFASYMKISSKISTSCTSCGSGSSCSSCSSSSCSSCSSCGGGGD